MPRVYRLMKREADRPKIGDAAMCLGVRPGEVPVNPAGFVGPGTGGLSVYDALRSIPAGMLPKRLRSLIPGAVNSNNLTVWALGEGPFAEGPIADEFVLRIDPDDPKHGFIEPRDIMPLGEYQSALARTVDSWAVDEAG